jgi:hypothetical protein
MITTASDDPGWSRLDTSAGTPTAADLVTPRRCPVCECAEDRTLLVFDDFQFFTDAPDVSKRVTLRDAQCRHCDAIYLNPCYSERGFHTLFAEAGQSYGSSEGRPQEQIDWLAGHGFLAAEKVILDAGCYDGRFLSRLPANLRRYGVDIDAPAIERGRRLYCDAGIELICGDFEAFVCPVAPDVITLFHVLEHLPRPVEVLRHLRELAHAGTRLVVEVPVIEQGLTNDINGFLSVQHMTHFSRHSLDNTLGRAGWKINEWFQASGYNGCRIIAEPGESIFAVTGEIADQAAAHAYLAQWHANLAQVHARLVAAPLWPRLVIWGAGLHTEFVHQVTPLFHLLPEREYLIVDSDPLKQGKRWRGIPILAPAALAELPWDTTGLFISSYGSQAAIAADALALGVPEARILRLYDHIARY